MLNSMHKKGMAIMMKINSELLIERKIDELKRDMQYLEESMNDDIGTYQSYCIELLGMHKREISFLESLFS